MAGWGDYPVIVAEALRERGHHVIGLGIAGHADAKVADACDVFQWIALGKLGAAIRFFKRHGVAEATMAGKIHKVVLFEPGRWLTCLPDWRMLRAGIPHFLTRRKDCKDDSLLTMIADEFAADGIRVVPATDYAPHLLVEPGHLTRRCPSPWQWKDIRFGWTMAKEMGRLDVGQSVAVKDQAVLAVEAVEGTDACIRRAGGLCRAGNFTVVKVAKPRQDMRFDVPTIGMLTLETMVQSGGRVLAVEAGRTILLDRQRVIEFANRHKLAIVAIQENATGTVG
jgi:DUF1009 family protein